MVVKLVAASAVTSLTCCVTATGAGLLEIAGRSGLGQDFELEFGGMWPAPEAEILVLESAKYRTTKFFPQAKDGQTHIRWGEHDQERRLTISVSGIAPVPFDRAPQHVQQALVRWVDKLAVQLRRDRGEG